MKHIIREYSVREFAAVLEVIREDKWGIFSAAARRCGLDPYAALARLLIRIVEDAETRLNDLLLQENPENN